MSPAKRRQSSSRNKDRKAQAPSRQGIAGVAGLTGGTVLRRIPELRVQLEARGTLKIILGGEVLKCGVHGLALLDAFSQPKSVSRALEACRSRLAGRQEWLELTNTLVTLYRAGVLQNESVSPVALKPGGMGYDAAPVHVAMLNDRARTGAYLAAIAEVVRAGDVVVDIGTGTGVLAMAAAIAGARRVYAIEAGAIGRTAEAIFAANGFEDRITLLPGWSTRTCLPEPADVLVSEMVGNEPFEEEMMEIILDARNRFLKPGARMIPNRIRVYGLPVSIPHEKLAKWGLTPETLRNWRAWYGMDFAPLAHAARGAPYCFLIPPEKTVEWPAIAEPLLLADVEFQKVESLVIEQKVTGQASAAGEWSGLLEYFELELSSRTQLSTHPARVAPGNHWIAAAWVLSESQAVEAGDRLEVSFTYPVVGSNRGRIGSAKVTRCRRG